MIQIQKTDEKENVDRYKVRLVAQGFSQKFGIDYNEVFAPVTKQATLRILLSIASKEKFFVKNLDVKTAFLNGEIQETIYMKQPQGSEQEGKEDHVCLLKKSLYGLCFEVKYLFHFSSAASPFWQWRFFELLTIALVSYFCESLA